MIGYILLFWVGLQMTAPTWYWWVLGIGMFINVLSFGLNMYKSGRDKE